MAHRHQCCPSRETKLTLATGQPPTLDALQEGNMEQFTTEQNQGDPSDTTFSNSEPDLQRPIRRPEPSSTTSCEAVHAQRSGEGGTRDLLL